LLEQEFGARENDLQEAETALEGIREKKKALIAEIEVCKADIESISVSRANIKIQSAELKNEVKQQEKVLLELKHSALISSAWIASKKSNIDTLSEGNEKAKETELVSSAEVSDMTKKLDEARSHAFRLKLEV